MAYEHPSLSRSRVVLFRALSHAAGGPPGCLHPRFTWRLREASLAVLRVVAKRVGPATIVAGMFPVTVSPDPAHELVAPFCATQVTTSPHKWRSTKVACVVRRSRTRLQTRSSVHLTPRRLAHVRRRTTSRVKVCTSCTPATGRNILKYLQTKNASGNKKKSFFPQKWCCCLKNRKLSDVVEDFTAQRYVEKSVILITEA